MGSLRLILAIAVVLAHVEGCRYTITGGATSVQCFYMISGFFITMILSEKYNKPNDLGLFYSNRLLRIYPVYWLFLGIAFVANLAAQALTHHSPFLYWTANQARMTHGTTAFLVASTLAIFGQDWTLFMGLGQHGLYWTSHYGRSSPLVQNFMMIPPAWSLAIELTFYLVAPWIVRQRIAVVTSILAGTLAFRYVGWQHDYRTDPWSYRFFPFELGMFLVGALAYRLIYAKIRSVPLTSKWRFCAFCIFPLILCYPLFGPPQAQFFTFGQIGLYIAVALSIPFLFQMTKGHSLDRRLGELSFPLYLCHYLIVSMLDHFKARLPSAFLRAVLSIMISLALAYAATRFFDEPINRFRERRLQRRRKENAPEVEVQRVAVIHQPDAA